MKKRSKKESRSLQVLFGLIELYLKINKPVGSHTLKEHGFDHLSSATIRNYFAELETQGLLCQPHSSGGRTPTSEAFRLYANEAIKSPTLNEDLEKNLQKLSLDSRCYLSSFLQASADILSSTIHYAVFLSSVRFDHDLILQIKLMELDEYRLLCVIITDFGQVLTEVLPCKGKVGTFAVKRIESYIQALLKGGEKPQNLLEEEVEFAKSLYHEIMVRYMVRYSNFSDEDIYRTGFSILLKYPEFSDPVALASGLSLFENSSKMRLLLGDCAKQRALHYWIGEDLAAYGSTATGCSVIAHPYYIGQTCVGAVGILGPCRMPYRELFGTLNFFTKSISKSLTQTIYKFKLSFRQPRAMSHPYIRFEKKAQNLLEIKE